MIQSEFRNNFQVLSCINKGKKKDPDNAPALYLANTKTNLTEEIDQEVVFVASTSKMAYLFMLNLCLSVLISKLNIAKRFIN